MSRFNPHLTVEPIYKAAALWKERCLLADGSILSEGKTLWSKEVLDELDTVVVQNPDAGDGDFLTKLKVQIEGGSPECKQLMAEHRWLMLLFPSNIGAIKKNEAIREIWSWSGDKYEPPEDHPLLGDDVFGGIGSAGISFNIRTWFEFVFLTKAIREFKNLEPDDRKRILGDPWAFSNWLINLPEARAKSKMRFKQLTHILPHLFFPDNFERISSGNNKRKILVGFGETTKQDIEKWDLGKIDRTLLELRHKLEQEKGTDIDFYQPEFLGEWQTQGSEKTQSGGSSWLLSWNPSEWNWDAFSSDRAATIAGGKVATRWPCNSTRPREGDRVFLIRTEATPQGIVAAGKVTRAPYKAARQDKDQAESGKPIRFIDVAFDSVRDASNDEILPLEKLNRRAPEQEWIPPHSGVKIKSKAAPILARMWKALPAISASQAPTDEIDPAVNLILYGPPGTGKTHRLMTHHLPQYQEERGEARCEFITFHQSYAYEDFVEGIRPQTLDGNVTYKVQDGVLKRLCDRARKAPRQRFALFIDEINRGNVAKIFGELISLVEIDKRIKTDTAGMRLPGCKGLEVTLPYSGERFGVPANVDIIGTMNTADRSIALLDTALRRRFHFEELTPKPELLDSIDDGTGDTIDLAQLLEAMNSRLERLLHRDQTLGHSYFYRVKTFDQLREVFAREILPFLQEAFYDDRRQIRLVLADQTVEEEGQLVRARKQNAKELFPNADSNEVDDGEAFEIVREDDITPDAIRKIYEPPE